MANTSMTRTNHKLHKTVHVIQELLHFPLYPNTSIQPLIYLLLPTIGTGNWLRVFFVCFSHFPPFCTSLVTSLSTPRSTESEEGRTDGRKDRASRQLVARNLLISKLEEESQFNQQRRIKKGESV